MAVFPRALFGPTVAFAYPDAKGWAALYAGMVLLIEMIFLEPALKRYQELGAKIQEMFDAELFGIPWNSYRCHAKPDPEVMINLAAGFKKKDETDRLVNWYPVAAGEVPIEYGRLVCQRANMRWDAALRRYYCVFSIVLTVVVSGAIALYMKWEASHIAISLVLPIMPAALKLLRECQKHQDSAAVSERTKSMLESIWGRALTERKPSPRSSLAKNSEICGSALTRW